MAGNHWKQLDKFGPPSSFTVKVSPAFYSSEHQKASPVREDSDTQLEEIRKHISEEGMRKLGFSVTADDGYDKGKSCGVFILRKEKVADSTWHQTSI